ncbi:MAG: hypothetical protein IRZ07_15085, partial [Microbispora sp.]|nr:hypothetical protein [Microbispora sp.]
MHSDNDGQITHEAAGGTVLGLPGVHPRVILRRITAQDEDEFLELVRASADLHHPWMSLPAT